MRHEDRNAIRATIIICALAGMAFALAGCGTRTQLQDVSNARSGAQAVKAHPERQTPEALGLADFVLAATDAMPLPEPTLSTDQIGLDPSTYQTKGAEAAKDPKPYIAPKPVDQTPGLFAMLHGDGQELIWWGRLVGAIGLIGWALCWAKDAFQWSFGGLAGIIFNTIINGIFGPFYKIGASVGGVAIAIGSALTWVGNHPVWSCIGLAAIGTAWFAYVHHSDIPKAIGWAKRAWAWMATMARRMMGKG